MGDDMGLHRTIAKIQTWEHHIGGVDGQIRKMERIGKFMR